MSFKKIFKEIEKLNQIDHATLSERMCKITEETGELAQVINKTNGRKYVKKGDTEKKINKNILEEGVDSVQCVFSLLSQAGFSSEDVLKTMKVKNKSWEKAIRKKTRTARHAPAKKH